MISESDETKGIHGYEILLLHFPCCIMSGHITSYLPCCLSFPLISNN